MTGTSTHPAPAEPRELPSWMLPDPNLPKLKMRRTSAGGYRITGLGAYGHGGNLETWAKACSATLEDHWSGTTDRPLVRFKSRLLSETVRRYRRWLVQTASELSDVMDDCDGLAAYEVTAFLGRSVRTARRVLRATRAQRQMVGPCGRQRWTGRYVY